jgi:phosphatidylglycerophosphate synthase
VLDPLLRPLKDRALAPAAAAVGRRVHPNTLSLLGFAAGAGCAAVLALAPPSAAARAAALGLWLLGRVLDGLDGAVARRQGRQSDLGGYLDLMLDFTVYALVPIAATLGATRTVSPDAAQRVWPWLAVLLGSFYVNAASWMYLAALLEKRSAGAAARGEQTSVAMPSGLVEGTETIVLFALYILFPGALAALFGVTALLVWVTVTQRAVWAARALL